MKKIAEADRAELDRLKKQIDDRIGGEQTTEPSALSTAAGTDPHRAWRVEMEHARVDHNLGGVDEDESERLYQRISKLERLICCTAPTTFDGAHVVLDVMFKEMMEGDQGEHMAEARRLLAMFLYAQVHVLEEHDLLGWLERQCWESRICTAPMWRHHPAMPADLKAEVDKTPDPQRLCEPEGDDGE